MDETWYSKIESDVFTQVKYMLKDREDAPYPTLNCTTVNQSETPAELPCLYLHELQPVDAGQDLDNTSVNAVIHTVEVRIWSKDGQTACKAIATAAVAELKRMRYNIVMLPLIDTNNGLSVGIFRGRRMIAAGDKL